MNLWCLHGNLQLPSVWHPFSTTWTYKGKPVSLRCPNLWGNTAHDFDAWTTQFLSEVAQTPADAPRVLLGYSLGGRLALHAVLKNPELFAGVILVGTHPGLETETEREQQLAWDIAWGNRFLHEPWGVLFEAWDALPVFGGIPNPLQRNTILFKRTAIAETFDRFSKGRQANLLPLLAKLTSPPTLFISGEYDTRYRNLGNRIATACPAMTHNIVPDAGHRVPWENPDAFAQIIQVFLDQTS